MPKRQRLAKGIYRDAYGISIVISVNGKPQEERAEADTPLDKLIARRKRLIGQLAENRAPERVRGSLARDVVQYLKRLKGLEGYKAEKSHLRAWLHRWPTIKRWQITSEMIEFAIADWRNMGYSARTIRHRCRALESLFHRLDGSRAPTPFDDVKVPAKPKPRPVSVPDGLIAEVARNLHRNELAGTLRDGKTRARFLVRATTGRRPCEIMRAKPEDLQLEQRLWFPRTAKGGINTAIRLNDEQLAAWQLFVAANAWGEYDDRSFAKTLYRNGWPKSIKPKNLRHSTAVALRIRGADLVDIQEQLGHASIQTTTEHYLHVIPERQAETSARLDGRFTPGIFAPTLPRISPTNAPRLRKKGQESLGKHATPKTA